MDLSSAHRQLQDAVQADEDARHELSEIEKQYRACQAKAKQGRELLEQALQRLSKTHVTFMGLSKTQVGVTVNKLRKHEKPSVQAAADKLVRSWKSIVEQHQYHHKSAPVQPAPGQPVSATPNFRGVQGSGTCRVLDAVPDEYGHVEVRILP